ncbi:S1 family peptidase [Streptomyces sp. 8K308]|uniref:S1 family peptidase n=1 Tax=Streptomyces sp. 8K308 TaxID=2530388 RepID=UPI00104AA52B|nr:S1 family peptidase [Streptomyces sp. 8K308]TDC11199.1 S1 family peptidase [Streptomyces sp. 8K308]
MRPRTVLATALLLAALTAPGASADTPADPLQDRLGDRTAGSYLDDEGDLVITVTDTAAARAVTAAGATPRLVERDAADLAAVADRLAERAAIPGTTWGVAPAANQVLVTHDDSVNGDELARLRAVVAALGDAARLEHSPGTLSTTIAGGEAVYRGGRPCSLGFNVTDGEDTYFLTAGHCTNGFTDWFADSAASVPLGTTVDGSFPADDYGLVRYTNATIAKDGGVHTYDGHQDITATGTPVVGQPIARSGRSTGVRTGEVTALDVTVNYAEGTVTGLIATTACAFSGDSGGPLYSGTTGYGLLSGSSGSCDGPASTTFFQPVDEVLAEYGVTVY